MEPTTSETGELLLNQLAWEAPPLQSKLREAHPLGKSLHYISGKVKVIVSKRWQRLVKIGRNEVGYFSSFAPLPLQLDMKCVQSCWMLNHLKSHLNKCVATKFLNLHDMGTQQRGFQHLIACMYIQDPHIWKQIIHRRKVFSAVNLQQRHP